jgi:hypothetical protein
LVKKVLAATAAAIVLVVPAADAAKPKMTKAQAVEAAEKYMKKSAGFKTKTITCTRTTRSSFKCAIVATVKSSGESCVGGVAVMFRRGKPWATGDKLTSREPNSCANASR